MKIRIIGFIIIASVASSIWATDNPWDKGEDSHTSSQAGEILDRNTVRNGMHSCPWGMFVTGVHIIDNKLLCADSYGNYSREIVDGDDEPPTVCNGMHCCPKGMAMTGIHAAKNLLACARFDPSRVGFGKAGWMPRVDEDTVRKGMHACPSRRPLLGIHEQKNLLTCIGPSLE